MEYLEDAIVNSLDWVNTLRAELGMVEREAGEAGLAPPARLTEAQQHAQLAWDALQHVRSIVPVPAREE